MEKESILERYVLNQTTWENLPDTIKKMMDSSKEKWKEEVSQYCYKYQLRWRENNLLRSIFTDERQYYQEVLRICFEQQSVCIWLILGFNGLSLDLSLSYCRHYCAGITCDTTKILYDNTE
jgi:hypothetical protein